MLNCGRVFSSFLVSGIYLIRDYMYLAGFLNQASWTKLVHFTWSFSLSTKDASEQITRSVHFTWSFSLSKKDSSEYIIWEAKIKIKCIFTFILYRAWNAFSHSHSHSHFSWAFLSKGERCTRLTLCEAPTRETRPDHNTGNVIPYSFR